MQTLKAAKDWFQKHPTCKVVYHWRWSDLPAASKEMMTLPRTVAVRGTRAVFGPHLSELSLRSDTDTSRITEGGLLDILGADGRIIVTYAPAE